MTKAEMQARLAQLEIDNSALRNHIGQSAGASVAVPGFVQPPATTPAKPAGPRAWKRGAKSVSKAGYPQDGFSTPTRNGGTFECKVPSDLVAAIKAGL